MGTERAIFALLLFTTLPFENTCAPVLNNLKSLCYVYQRDLNLAFMQGISKHVDGMMCGVKPQSLYGPTVVEAFKYTIDLVNSRQDLLPNISLGFVILDTCYYDLAALAQTLYLVPDPADPEVTPPEVLENCTGARRRFDVDGLIGPVSSREGAMMGGLATLFRLPTLLTYASSDELGDKSRFGYVMRMVPPDRYQASAILDFLLRFGWTYISLLYRQGAYGENGARMIERHTKNHGICIAYSNMIRSDFGVEQFREVVKQMSSYRNARAVVLFLYNDEIDMLFSVVERSELSGYFIWVGSDSFSPGDLKSSETDGSFSISFDGRTVEPFLDHFDSLTPANNVENPWFRGYWELAYDCRWDIPPGNTSSCYSVDIRVVAETRLYTYSRVMDSVLVFAHALNALIEKHCPYVFNNKTDLDGCVTGERLLPALLHVSFEGYSGRVKFDKNGDFIGQYVINQYIRDSDVYVPVARWDKETEQIELYKGELQWHMFANVSQDSNRSIPESVCSKPCREREYYIQKELSCCWECRRCRNNEIMVENKTDCQICPEFTWPDGTALICVPITAEVLRWNSPLGIALSTIAAIGIVSCIAIGTALIKNSNVRLIKASSRQLMIIILGGIMMAYVNVFFLIAEPSPVSCHVGRFGFALAVSLIYVPLMVKTNRIYRIFTTGRRGTKRPGLIGTRPQLIFVTIFIVLEVALIIVTVVIAPPNPTKRMKVPTEKYVELFCDLPLEGLLPPLTANLVFLLVCALYGFLTRKLPQNFNESWYIFISVTTTSFLWLVFLPAYFTAFYAVHQVTLLASCLTINALVSLLCLYVPKIYAIYFVDEDNLEFQVAGSFGTGSVVPASQSVNTRTATPNTSVNQ